MQKHSAEHMQQHLLIIKLKSNLNFLKKPEKNQNIQTRRI